MSDIIRMLRVSESDPVQQEAADEIERLRAHLEAEQGVIAQYRAAMAELTAEREVNQTNQVAIERFRQHESELREALNPLADAKPLRRDLDVYVVAGRDVRYARMTLDAALKGDGDD